MPPEMKSPSAKQFRCTHPGCDKVFNRKDYLERHAANHLFVKPFVCKLCDRQFSRKDLYDNHLMTKRHARAVLEADTMIQSSARRHRESDLDSAAVFRDNMKRRSPDPNAPDLAFRRLPPAQPLHLVDDVVFQTTGSNAFLRPLPRPMLYSASLGGSIGGSSIGGSSIGGSSIGGSSIDGSSLHSGRPSFPGFELNSAFRPPGYSSETNSQVSVPSSITSSNSSHTWSEYAYSPTFRSGESPVPHDARSRAYSFQSFGQTSESSDSQYGPLSETRTPVEVIEDSLRIYFEKHPPKYMNFRQALDHDPKTGDSASKLSAETKTLGMPSDDAPSLNRSETLTSLSTAFAHPLDACSHASKRSSENACFRWFFDDQFEIDKAKYGYDRYYTDLLGIYTDRLAEVRGASWSGEKMFHTPQQCSVSLETSLVVLQILQQSVEDIEDENVVGHWIQTAWEDAPAVSHGICPATFVADEVHPSLLVVLALLGMALDPDPSVQEMALKAFASALLYVFQCVECMPKLEVPQISVLELSKLQAFSLIIRIDQVLFKKRKQHECFITSKYGRLICNLFVSKVLPLLPTAGTFEPKRRSQPIYASMYNEGYIFHDGANEDVQWREWVAIETLNRVTMSVLYHDTIYSLTMPSMDPISLVHLDVFTVAPDALWYCSTATEFFTVVGASRTIPALPYLGLLKSLIRFARSPMLDCIESPLDTVWRYSSRYLAKKVDGVAEVTERDKQFICSRFAWGPFGLKTLSQGLIIILSTYSGVLPAQTNDVLNLLIHSHANVVDKVLKRLDFDLQLRLYRGLDMWRILFCTTYGDKTDMVLNFSGTACLPLQLDLDRTHGTDPLPHFSILMILIYYCSFVYVHDDLPIVLEITSNLRQWLDLSTNVTYDTLADYLYMPLYQRWILTEGARSMLGACLLYLLWSHSAYGQVYCKNQKFMSAMIYISGVVVWLYDFLQHDETSSSLNSPVDETKSAGVHSMHFLDEELEIGDFEFMETGTKYLQTTFSNLFGQAPRQEKPKGIKSVVLLVACLLNKRSLADPWVETLVKLLGSMDSKYTQAELLAVVKQSAKKYESPFIDPALGKPGFSSPANTDADPACESPGAPTKKVRLDRILPPSSANGASGRVSVDLGKN